MKRTWLLRWFSVVAAILVLFGLIYAFAGLSILPVKKASLLHWESALYGAIMAGWGVTLLLVGRIAFRRRDRQLMGAMLFGITVWLAIEAAFSVHLGVWFNVGVDVFVLSLFAVPLTIGRKP